MGYDINDFKNPKIVRKINEQLKKHNENCDKNKIVKINTDGSTIKNTKSKYNNIKTVIDGIKFDSKKEATRYQELILLQKDGKIKDLCLQQKFMLVPKIEKNRQASYLADFTYWDEKTNKFVVEDCKGFKTDVYKLKKKIMKEKYDIDILET